MTKQEQDKQILADAPKNAVAIKMIDKAYRWHLVDNTYSKIFTDELLSHDSFEDVHTERDLDDIRELVALRDEVAKYRRADKAFKELNEHLGIGGDE
jgi:hypothetical protein